MKKRMKLNVKPEGRYEVFFFLVLIAGPNDGISVLQIKDRPEWATNETDSLLQLGGAKVDDASVDMADYALNISWLPFKPDPESDLRRRGLLAVMRHLTERTGDGDRIKAYGIGHLDGAKVEFHEGEQ